MVECIAGEGPIMPGLTAEAPARAVGRYQLDTEVGRLTPAERAARGKAARAHAVFDPPADRFVGGSKHANQGQRVVAGQRITAEHGL
jgi:hypothetical protein